MGGLKILRLEEGTKKLLNLGLGVRTAFYVMKDLEMVVAVIQLPLAEFAIYY